MYKTTLITDLKL